MAENKLARRFEDHRNNIPDDVLKDLRFCSTLQEIVQVLKQRLIDKEPIPAHMWPRLRACIDFHDAAHSHLADVWQELLLLGAPQVSFTETVDSLEEIFQEYNASSSSRRSEEAGQNIM